MRQNRASIVATFIVPLSFGFVVTILELSIHSVLPALTIFANFLADFTSFALNPYKSPIWVKIP